MLCAVLRSLGYSTVTDGATMTSKLLLIVIAVAVLAAINDRDLFSSFETPVALAVERKGRAINKHEFQPLFDEGKPFSPLAKGDHYTVVEGYLDSCAICKRLEAGFDDFVSKRKDVSIQRVHFPESGIQMAFTGSSQAEIQQLQQDYERRIKSYKFCGTPHVEVYDADRHLIAADNCTSREGTRFLEQWMVAE